MTPWHRLLGLVMIDHFSGSHFKVQVEKDLSERQKFLDILLIIEGTVTRWKPKLSPDGLAPADLRPHNLISFKSYQESLTADAIEHLISCVSDYRYLVQVEKRLQKLVGEPERLPDHQLQTIAITARYPDKLRKALKTNWRKTSNQGVYEVTWGTRVIKVIVCRQVAMVSHNALWLIFSGDEKRVAFAMKHFGLNNHDMSTILSKISETYQIGGLNMPYTIEDFRREILEEAIEKIKTLPEEEQQRVLSHLPPKIRLEGLDPKDRLAGLDPKDRLAGLDPKDRLAGLDPKDRLAGLDPKDRLEGLSREEMEELRKLING
jgi:hypothetical protein